MRDLAFYLGLDSRLGSLKNRDIHFSDPNPNPNVKIRIMRVFYNELKRTCFRKRQMVSVSLVVVVVVVVNSMVVKKNGTIYNLLH